MQPMILSHGEVEGIVRGLQPLPLTEIGTAPWKSQREYMEQLNQTTHGNASQRHDDYVATAFVNYEKMPILIHEALVMDTFRRRLAPTILKDILACPTGQYIYLHYEGVLINLMECILFQEDCVKALDEDASEFMEYCWRNVVDVLVKKHKMHDWFKQTLVKRSATEQLAHNEQMEKTDDKLRFSIAMSSLSCLWFIVERLNQLPMAVANCALLKMDLIVSLAEVIDAQPWLIREGGKVYKWIGQEFKECASHEDSLLLCTPEAHCWFALHFLMCDGACRKKYLYNDHRKQTLGRIRKYLHEILIDQVPMLTDVQRALEELSFMNTPSSSEERFRSSLVIEPVPRVMSAVESAAPKRGHEALAKVLRDRICSPEAVREDAMKMAKMFDAMFGA